MEISGYVIDAEIDTVAHHLKAKAVVSFTAPENLDMVSFGFHPALKLEKITDETGKVLTGDRSADGTIRVTPATPFVKGQVSHWTFEYGGTITGNDDGPVEGLKLAAIQEPITYLLYPARWFPMTEYMTDRFTAEMHIRVPQGMKVFASGSQGASKPVTLSDGKPGDEFDFNWTKPGFPGTVIAGRFLGPVTAGPGNVSVYLTVAHQVSANQLAQTAAKEYDFFTDSFGGLETTHLNVVELPDDTLPAVWAPELAAIMGSRVGDKSGVRLLANTIAHQWWGSQVSPRTLNDAWITNGMARYGELMYLEEESGRGALKSALQDVSAGALAYDTIPLSSAGRLSPFSPQFQSMTLEKGAMIFHMLRGQTGDKAFLATLKGALGQYTDASMSTRDFVKVAEANSQLLAVGGWDGRTQVHRQVRRLPAGQQQGVPYHRRDRPGSGSIQHAGGAAGGHRRQDRDPEGGRGGHQLAVRGGHLRASAADRHRPRRLGSQVHARSAGAHRHPEGAATGGTRRPGGRAE
jgi:hypothetical protein